MPSSAAPLKAGVICILLRAVTLLLTMMMGMDVGQVDEEILGDDLYSIPPYSASGSAAGLTAGSRRRER